MEDFKNENEYGNMKTEETYEGIILKTGDEGYRYYSEDDYSEDSSIADIIITCGYVSETSSTARVNMSATCENADDLYIRLLKDEGTVLYSTGTSGTSFSTQKTFVSAGTYIVEAEVVRTNGGRKVRRAPLRVETSVGEQNRCDMCDETGWMSATTQCTSCGAWQTHAAPIQISHYNESVSISTVTVNMSASCTNAVDMYLRVIREDGTECYSRHASSTNISKTMPLGAGRYTLQAEAISLTGGIRIATNEMVINPGNSSSSGSSSGGCYNCGGTGYVGSYNCSICNPSTGSSGSSSNNCSNCGGTGYVGSGNCSICNPSTSSSGSSSNNCSNCGGTGYVGSANCSVCNPEIKSYDCSYCLDTGWLNGQKCTHCSTDDLGPNGIDITPSYSIDSTLYTLNVTATCGNAWWMRAEVENTTFSNEASTNNVSLEAIELEEGSYSVKVTAQRNGIYRYQYANVTLKNREISYACPPYINFSNETGEYNSTTGKYSVSVSVYCEDATHIDMEILNNDKALCASIDGSGTSASGICDLVAGKHYAKFVIERGSLGTIEDVYAFDVNATTTGGGDPTSGNEDDTTTTPEVEDIPDNERKFLLLYTGPDLNGGNYETFTTADIQRLKECGATDFVLLTAASYNRYNGKSIIEEIPGEYEVYSSPEKYMEEYSTFLDKVGIELNNLDLNELHYILWEEAPAEKPYEVHLFKPVNNDVRKYSEWGNGYSYDSYIEEVINLANKLVEKIPCCNLWIGLPPMIPSTYFLADKYIAPYKYIVDNVLYENKGDGTNVPRSFFNNIQGFYYGTEEIPHSYTKFEEDNRIIDYNLVEIYDDCFKNIVIYNMSVISNYVHTNYNKKMLWIPYYHVDTELCKRVSYVASRTNIFDFVILQTSYYFNGDNGQSNMEVVKKCIEQQEWYYPTGSNLYVTGIPKGDSKTQIGVIAEMDYTTTEYGLQQFLNYSKLSEAEKKEHDLRQFPVDVLPKYKDRHKEFVKKFADFVNGTDETESVCMAFYGGERDDMFKSNIDIIGNVKEFFKYGKAIE